LGNQVELVTEFKVLGVTIGEKFTLEAHFKLLRAKVTEKLFATVTAYFQDHGLKSSHPV
jgi:hypothetical protein